MCSSSAPTERNLWIDQFQCNHWYKKKGQRISNTTVDKCTGRVKNMGRVAGGMRRNTSLQHQGSDPTLFPWILYDQSACVMMRGDNIVGFVLLNSGNQEVPQGNNPVSKPKHLTQVTVLIESSPSLGFPEMLTVISEQNKTMTSEGKRRRKKRTCSQLRDSVID